MVTATHSLESGGLRPIEMPGGLGKVEELRVQAATLCGLSPDRIEDIYPCTPFQEGVFTRTLLDPDAYIARYCSLLPADVNIEALKTACATAFKDDRITRTRIIRSSSQWIQVVVKEGVPFLEDIGGSTQKEQLNISTGQPLTRLILGRREGDGRPELTYLIHHALYDGWSIRTTLLDLSNAYRGKAIVGGPGFDYFARYVRAQNEERSQQYWRDLFRDLRATRFPNTQSTLKMPVADKIAVCKADLPNLTTTASVLSTFVKLAWAIVISEWTQCNDVVFGTIHAGRARDVVRVREIRGPTLTITPVRITLDPAKSVSQMAEELRRQSVRTKAHEHIGLSVISQASDYAQQACRFQSVLTVQPQEYRLVESGSLGTFTDHADLRKFSSHAISLEAVAQTDFVGLRACYDSRTVSSPDMETMLQQLGATLEQLLSSPHLNLDMLGNNPKLDFPAVFNPDSVSPLFGPDMRNAFPARTYIAPSIATGRNSTAARVRAISYWQAALKGCGAQQYPELSDPNFVPCPQTSFERLFNDVKLDANGMNTTVILRSALSILLSRYTNSDEVVFGTHGSSKTNDNMTSNSIKAMSTGIVPLRVEISRKSAIAELLQSIQKQAIETAEVDEIDLSSISEASEDARQACLFQTILLIDQDSDRHRVTLNDLVKQYPPRALIFQCSVAQKEMSLRIHYDSRVFQAQQAELATHHLERIVIQLLSPENSSSSIASISATSGEDLRRIRGWNQNDKPEVDDCVHHMLSRTMRSRSEFLAVDAWDGQLTYRQLDGLSDLLAHAIIEFDIQPNKCVLLHFEKSKWTSIALLGVMKAGGASVCLDVSQPRERLQTIVTQAGVALILCSKNSSLAHNPLGLIPTLVLDDKFYEQMTVGEIVGKPCVDVKPWNVAGVVFTSGSTGRPKGACLSHQNLSTALKYQPRCFSMNPGTRTYDFVSYNFDLSWLNSLHTFYSGGCLCVPSEHDRMNATEDSISRFGANFVLMPPSLARQVDFHLTPSIRTLVLGGEPAVKLELPNHIQLFNVYGPAECTLFSTFADSKQLGLSRSSIGLGLASNTWVMTTTEPRQLCCVGEIGELLLEGPLVGPGYINDSDETNRAFSLVPTDLLCGESRVPALRSRLYQTGDLVRYLPNGDLVFVGRKDSQVKIRGQRVELAEIEYHLRVLLKKYESSVCDVIVEVIKPGARKSSTLVAYVVSAEGDAKNKDLPRKLPRISTALSEGLARLLPSYMVPNIYLPLDIIPRTASGKIDRNQIRNLGEQHHASDLVNDAASHSRRLPTTANEISLTKLWAIVLSIQEPAIISTEDNFFHLGGDSILAMRLVALARKDGISLSVLDIFKNPRLIDMALCCSSDAGDSTGCDSEPFALVDSRICEDVFALLPEPRENVADVLPVSAFQNRVLTGCKDLSPAWTGYHAFDLPGKPSIGRVIASCRELIRTADILRTVFVKVGNIYYQAVLNSLDVPIDIKTVERDIDIDSSTVCVRDGSRPFHTALCWYFCRIFILHINEEQIRVIWRLSHAQQDGTSLELLGQTLGGLCRGQTPAKPASFAGLVRHFYDYTSERRHYWDSILNHAVMTYLPPFPSTPIDCEEPLFAETEIPLPSSNHCLDGSVGTNFTVATIFTAASAVALSQVTKTTDVLFGRVVSGRSPLRNADQSTIGCCISVAPVRVQIPSKAGSGLAYLHRSAMKQVQEQYTLGLLYEHVPVDQLRGICGERDFGLITVFQNFGGTSDASNRVKHSIIGHRPQVLKRNKSPLCIATPVNDKLRISIAANTVYEQRTIDAMLSIICLCMTELSHQHISPRL